MNRYKLLSGTHTIGGVTFRAGDGNLLTEEQIKGLSEDRIVIAGPGEGEQQSTRTESSTETEKPNYTPMTVDVAGINSPGSEPSNSTANSTNTTTETSKDWSKTQDMKATDVIAMIKETDSKEELEALQEVEENGQNRVGVMKEIDKRLAQLEEEEE